MIFKDLTKENRNTFFGTISFAVKIIIQKPNEKKQNNVFSELFSYIFIYVIAYVIN